MDLRIKIRPLKGHPLPPQSQILSSVVAAAPDINIIDINKTIDGILLTLQDRKDLYCCISKDVQDNLKANNLQAIPPQWLSVNNSLFAPKMADAITENSSQDIVKDVLARDKNIGLIDAIVLPSKFNDNRTLKAIKFIFETPDKMEEALQKGFRVMNVVLGPDRLFRNKDANLAKLKQCFKCFLYDHYSNECPLTHGLCSICGRVHNFRECPTPNNPKCKNCNQKHTSIAKECVVRKKEMEKLINKQKNKPIAKPTASNNRPIDTPTPTHHLHPTPHPNSTPHIPESYPWFNQGTWDNFPPLLEKTDQCSALVQGPIIFELAKLEAAGNYEQATAVREAANRYLITTGYNPIGDPNQSPFFKADQRRRILKSKRNNRRPPPPPHKGASSLNIPSSQGSSSFHNHPPKGSEYSNNSPTKESSLSNNQNDNSNTEEQQHQQQQSNSLVDGATPSILPDSLTHSHIEPGQLIRQERDEETEKLINEYLFMGSLPPNPSPLPLIEQNILSVIEPNNKSNQYVNVNTEGNSNNLPLSPLEKELPSEFANFPDSQDEIPEFPPRKIVSKEVEVLDNSPDSPESLPELKIVEYSSEESNSSEGEVTESLEHQQQLNGHTVHTCKPKMGINTQVINEIVSRKARVNPGKRFTRSALKN